MLVEKVTKPWMSDAIPSLDATSPCAAEDVPGSSPRPRDGCSTATARGVHWTACKVAHRRTASSARTRARVDPSWEERSPREGRERREKRRTRRVRGVERSFPGARTTNAPSTIGQEAPRATLDAFPTIPLVGVDLEPFELCSLPLADFLREERTCSASRWRTIP